MFKEKQNIPLNYSALCIRATSLHNNLDKNDSKQYGNNLSSVKSKVLTFGDAFDCDVNYDEKYDEETEKFYYLSSRVARFLTTKEIELCSKKYNCSFLLENVEDNHGYWLENRTDSGMVYALETNKEGEISLNEYSADYYGFGVRPVINVRIDDIIY